MRNSIKITNRINRLESKVDKYIQKAIAAKTEWDEITANNDYKFWNKGIREAKDSLRYWEAKEIQSFCNQHGYSDVHPYEVVNVISDTTVEVRAMRTVQTKFPKDFHPGGFCGHYADNVQGQDYEYISNPDYKIERVRWSEANKQWQQGTHGRFHMSGAPCKHHDYNF